ncbi:hypothetical protein AU210_006834 [Fusarium oxysporum f. sp. radicis-cucumerinum]|uniref:BZIP domain-containing protein n=1 Tax=Fusarium oxysporum f. sp. radicis-cucumerinum TaxID=327505 RepID=A0A2H3H936_FUSOX|nr:hypothetical protein AU210_006834 [Fusarium oxysporum f. sp. radicis-cucumerinum]
MPRKTRTPESLALNRENQRRSRARQRELLDDLQNRVREFERRDGQATLEMQRVARAVAGENAALRGLLAAKGVSIEEVEAHVAAVKHEEKMVARAGVATVTPVSTPSSNASPVVIASRPMSCSQPQGCAPVRENSNPSFAIQPKMYSPPTPTTTATSCTEESGCSATILAQIRGQSDISQARAVLGCAEGETCMVRNTDLLNLMDEMT